MNSIWIIWLVHTSKPSLSHSSFRIVCWWLYHWVFTNTWFGKPRLDIFGNWICDRISDASYRSHEGLLCKQTNFWLDDSYKFGFQDAKEIKTIIAKQFFFRLFPIALLFSMNVVACMIEYKIYWLSIEKLQFADYFWTYIAYFFDYVILFVTYITFKIPASNVSKSSK